MLLEGRGAQRPSRQSRGKRDALFFLDETSTSQPLHLWQFDQPLFTVAVDCDLQRITNFET